MYDNGAYESGPRGGRWVRLRRTGLLAAALACLALLATACSSPRTGPGPVGGSAKHSILAYSRCMRAHGISKFPDPNSQGALQIQATPGSDLDPNNPRFQAANKVCQHYQAGGKGGSLSTSGGPGGGA